MTEPEAPVDPPADTGTGATVTTVGNPDNPADVSHLPTEEAPADAPQTEGSQAEEPPA
jgi:hypothetical protein